MRQIEVILVAVTLASIFSIASASDTTTKFQTGPFTVSVDLGTSCNDTNISKPVSSENLGGDSYTDYRANLCGVDIGFRRWDKDTIDLTSAFPTSKINTALLESGVDKDTIDLYSCTIDGKPGAVGKGYAPKLDKMDYAAAFHVSRKSFCYIYVWDNETMMISALKSIHITEA